LARQPGGSRARLRRGARLRGVGGLGGGHHGGGGQTGQASDDGALLRGRLLGRIAHGVNLAQRRRADVEQHPTDDRGEQAEEQQRAAVSELHQLLWPRNVCTGQCEA
jgi:hypothetical protein